MVVALEAIILQSDANGSKLKFCPSKQANFHVSQSYKKYAQHTCLQDVCLFLPFILSRNVSTSPLILIWFFFFSHFPRFGGGYLKDDKSCLRQFSENWKRKSETSCRNTSANNLSWSHLTNTQTVFALEKQENFTCQFISWVWCSCRLSESYKGKFSVTTCCLSYL